MPAAAIGAGKIATTYQRTATRHVRSHLVREEAPVDLARFRLAFRQGPDNLPGD
jgi:hypothetical protein